MKSNIASEVERSKLISQWIQKQKNENALGIKNDEKSLSVAACFDITLEHQKAITLLIENECYGSASALGTVNE